MNRDSHKKGYARLIMDLAKSDTDHSFQEQLSKSTGATQELAFLLQLAKYLETRNAFVALPECIPPSSGQND